MSSLNGASGAQLAITVSPGPKDNARGRAVRLDPHDPVDSYARTIGELRGLETWYAPSVFLEGHRANEDWRTAAGVTGDLDYVDTQGEHSSPPPEARAALERAFEDAPGSIAYHTPRGARVDAVLSAPVAELATWRRAAEGLAAQLGVWLRRHRLDGDRAAGLAGYTVDPSAKKPAQYMFAPRARVEGAQREATVRVLRPTAIDIAELLAAAPAPEAPKTPPVVRSTPALERFEEARAAFCADHALEATRKGSPCPANGCDGSNSYKALGDTGKATCFHSSHPESCGGPGVGCRVFDALDLAAHNAGRSPAEHLRAEGYLAEGQGREEPPPIGDEFAPPEPKRSREPGEDDRDEPAGPSADYVTPGRRTAEEIRGEVRSVELDRAAPLLADTAAAATDMFARRASGKERPIPLPWPCLSDPLGGGLWPGLHVVTGPTGTGKSALALQVGLHAARNGVAVLYIGLELDTAQIHARLRAQILTDEDPAHPVQWSDIYLGRDAALVARAAEIAAPALAKIPLRVEEAPPGGWTPSTLRARVRAIRAAHPGASGLLVVLDYLQLVGSEPDARRDELRERVERAATIGREVARRDGVAVLMLSSISRAAARELGLLGQEGQLGQGDPADLVGLGAESARIEYAADTVAALAREPRAEDDTGPTLVHIALAKVRSGPPAWALMRWCGSHYEPAQQSDADRMREHRGASEARRAADREASAARAQTDLARKIGEALAEVARRAYPDQPKPLGRDPIAGLVHASGPRVTRALPEARSLGLVAEVTSGGRSLGWIASPAQAPRPTPTDPDSEPDRRAAVDVWRDTPTVSPVRETGRGVSATEDLHPPPAGSRRSGSGFGEVAQ